MTKLKSVFKLILMLFVVLSTTLATNSESEYATAYASSSSSSGNTNTNFNPNYNPNFNPNSAVSSLSSNSSFNPNNFPPKTNVTSVVSNSSASNDSLPNCFYDTVGNIVNRLQSSVMFYANLCSLQSKPLINRFITAARIISTIEGYRNMNLTSVPANVIAAVNSLDQFSDFKFSSYLVQIKAGFASGKDVSGLVRNLWASMSDELDLIVKNNNYPFFFRVNVWSLVQSERALVYLRVHFAGRENQCVPNDWEDILQLNDLSSDQNFMKIFRPKGGNCKTDATDISISSNAFENGGIAITFWGSENLEELNGKQHSPLTGYINNQKIYEYTLIPQKFSVIHQLKVMDRLIQIKSNSNCASYYFAVFSIQKDCENYVLHFSVRFLASNTRQSGRVQLKANQVENLHLVFDKKLTFDNHYYKNFKYTPDTELLLLAYSLNTANWKTLMSRARCAPNCEYSNGIKCLFCKPPTQNHEGNCVFNCPQNTFANNGTCTNCNSNCKNCTGPANGNCVACKEPLYFANGKCDIRCPDNMAEDPKRNCHPCGNNCLVCKDLNNCGKCSADHFLLNGKCVPNCGDRHYKSFNPNTCKPCLTGCHTCNSAEKCTSCSEGFFLKGNNCVPDCGNEFWSDKTTRTCKSCEKNCKKCKDSVNCFECNKGFHNHNQDCVSDCPVGTISVNGVCGNCKDKNCNICSANNVAECKKCNSEHFLKNVECVKTCGNGFYPDLNKSCLPCPKDCNVCSKDKCLQCKDNQFVLRDTICVKECPDGYVASGNTCVKCTFPTDCRKCLTNNLETCTACYGKKVLHNGKCLDTCPDKFFIGKDNKCEPCIKGCDRCQNALNCEVCSKTHFLQNHLCVEKCSSGFAAIGNNVCQPCKVGGCEVCGKNLNNCEKCVGKKYLYNNQCIDKCPLGAYPLATQTCDTCASDCIECTSKLHCTRCRPGKVLQGTNCVSVCDDGFVSVDGVCTKCKNSNCRRCLPNNLSHCTECPVNKLLHAHDCVKVCPDKTFASKGTCLDCHKPCNKCKDEKTCIDCINKFSLHNTTCTDNCPERTFSVNQVCHKCHDNNCLKCKDVIANSCIHCAKGFAIFNGVCVQNCPENHWNENGVCKPCLKNCKQCKNANTCEKCIDKFFLKEGIQCEKSCGDGYVELNNVCRKCHNSCHNCKTTNINECTSCPAKYYLYANECKASCPEGTFPTEKMTCQTCPIQNCRNCLGGKTCTQCNANYVLENNVCRLPPCSEGWVLKPKSTECTRCEVKNCRTCPNTNTKICDQCVANHVLIGDNRCEKECIIETFKNPVTRKCQNCSKNCIACTNDVNCSQCENNYFLHENHCVSQCPSGHSKSNGKCVPCAVKNCDKCTDNAHCEKCAFPHLLSNGLCEKECKKGHYNDNGVCKKCTVFCEECRNGNSCITCLKGKVLSAEEQCIDQCPSGTININGKCVRCKSDKNCDKCDIKDLTKCLECGKNMVLKAGTCVENCGDSFFVSQRTCHKCKDNCKKCVDQNKCIECNNGYALHQETCLITCPKGFRKENGKCLPCPQDCETCDAKQCLTCLPKAFLEDKKCVKTCSSGYFTSHGIACHPCSTGCQTCLSAESCTICVKGLFIKDGKCVPTCGSGWVAINGKCQKCPSGCEQCSHLNAKECVVCEKGRPLLNGICQDKCPAKHYTENNKCLPCIKGCDTCSNGTTCSKCTPPLYLANDRKSCSNKCPDGYRADQGLCSPCEDKKCQKCGSNVNLCEVCSTPHLVLSGTCIKDCPAGYYKNDLNNACHKCDPTCTRCVGAKKCTECAKGFVLQDDHCTNSCKPGHLSVNATCQRCETHECDVCGPSIRRCEKCNKGKVLFTVTNSTLHLAKNLTNKIQVNGTVRISNHTLSLNSTICLDNCPLGFYDAKGACLPCEQNCNKCTNLLQCNVCDKGFVLQNGHCQKRCDKYHVEKNGECVKCNDPKCVNCDPLTLKQCAACDENHVLHNNECKTSCGIGFFKFAVGRNNSICKPCTYKCEVCDNAESCKRCLKGAYMKDNKCVTDCGSGWVVKDNYLCVQCTSKYCVSCDPHNPDKCIACSSEAYLKNGLCVKTCGEKYAPNDKGLCLPCTDARCVSCSPHNKCTQCEKGKVIVNGECKDSCPSGMIANKTNVCVNCADKNCHSCELTNVNKCEKCKSGYLLQTNLTCDKTCPQKHYNYLNERCLPCAKGCEQCKSDTSCSKCEGKLVLDHNNMCTDDCKKGYVEQKGKCIKCTDAKCSKCNVNDNAICEVCLPGTYLYQGKCHTKCPSKTFALGSNCVNCPKHCKDCESDTKCKVCDGDYFLLNNVCLEKCPEGYRPLPGECVKCPNFDKTKSCDRKNPVIPIECRDKYLMDRICVDNCPDGRFPDSKRVCQNCGTNCVKCGSLTDCKKCNTNTKLHKGVCVNECPHETVNILGVCVDCKTQNCNRCQVSDVAKCEVCKDKFVLHNHQCVTSCPQGYYSNGKSCEKCDPKCAECKNGHSCERCLNPFVLHEKNCTSQCPSGHVQRNGQCFACSDKRCAVCNNNDLNNCLKCKSGYLLNGLCHDKCPVTYRANNSTQTCQECSKFCDMCDEKGCKNCTKNYYFSETDKSYCMPCTEPSMVIVGKECHKCKVQGCKRCNEGLTGHCKVCDSTKVLVNGICLSECPAGSFQVGQECQPCEKNCKRCKNSKTCDECHSPHVLHNSVCVPTCPKSFVAHKGKCVPCAQTECHTCSADNTAHCQVCELPSLLYKNQCYKLCPSGTFPDGTVCKECPSGCHKCSKNKCEGCTNGLKLRGNECVKECGSGYSDNGAICEKCIDINCHICNPSNICKECNKNTFLVPSTHKCVPTCKEGSYENKEKRLCEQCDKGCASCSSKGQCTICEKGLVNHKGVCVSNCPDGYSPLANICKPCQESSCSKCSVKPDECEQCGKGFLFMKKCVPVCPKGSYSNKKNICRPCNLKCEECKDKFTCNKCKSEFSLHEGRCVDKCTEGKVEVNGKCISCADTNCKSCLRDISKCVECKSNFVLFDNVCRTVCPTGFFVPKDKKHCEPCSEGCHTCSDNSTCKKCVSGFFLLNKKCVRECPKGMWGNCKEDVCHNCIEACEDCSDGTATNCPRCAKGYFKNEDTCVKPASCRKGTYPNEVNRRCSVCTIPYCADCENLEKCKVCVRGFELSNKGVCLESKTFVPVVSQNPALYSTNTLRLMRNSEIKTFSQDLKGTAVDSEHVTFTFWIRRFTQGVLNTNIFETQSKNVAMNVKLEIRNDNKDRKERCRLVLTQGTELTILPLGGCSYADLYHWNFFAITLSKNGEKGSAVVKIIDHKGQEEKRNQDFKISKTVTFVNKDSTLIFNNNLNKNDTLAASPFEISAFNVLDYDATSQDLLEFSLIKPTNCDYTCTECRGTCLTCPGGVKAAADGSCPASFISVRNDFQRIANFTELQLRSKIVKSLDSENYGLYFWFNSESNSTKVSDIANVFYNYVEQEYVIRIYIEFNRLVIQVGSELFNVFEKVVINHNEWFFVGVSVKKQNLQIYLKSLNGLNEHRVIQLKNLPNRLTEDATFSTGPNRSHNNTRSHFVGSFYDLRLYTNNVPTGDQINDQFNRLPCPKHCQVCNKFLTCDRCINGYIVQGDKCVDNKLSVPVVLLEKSSFFRNSTLSLPLPQTFNNSQFTINFFYRKKSHSSQSPVHNILSFEGVDGRIYPLILELNGARYLNTFMILGQNTTSTNFTHDFSNEIYFFFHFAIQVDMVKRTLSYTINDGADHFFTKPINTAIRRFIVGDASRTELNYEIGNFFVYPGIVASTELLNLRSKAPRDCNPGCQTCDYKTGLCLSCLNDNTQKAPLAQCNNVLRGYSSAHIYNLQIIEKRLADQYSNSLHKVFSRDVNSLEYSVVGYFRLLDQKAFSDYKNNRFQIFRISNRDGNDVNPGTNLVAMEAVTTNGNVAYFIVYNDGDSVQRHALEVPVGNEWLLIYITVNVSEKHIKFAIERMNSSRVFQGTIKLKNFPEKLTEKGTMTLFGVGIGLPSEYKILNAQFYKFYLGPNLKHDLSLLEKFKKALPYPADPKCPDNCEKCISNDNNVAECLACQKGFELENDKCYRSDSKYVILSDQNTYTYLPPSTDMVVPSTAALFPKNTITFYFRRNNMPEDSSISTIFKGGNVQIKLSADFKGQASLIVSVDQHPSSLLFPIDTDLNADYSWYYVVINYSNDTLDVIVKNDRQNQKKGLKVDTKTIKIAISSISFNTNGDQFSIYGPNIIMRGFYEPEFVRPNTLCELDCDMCQDNKCVEWQWGTNEDGSFVRQPVEIRAFRVSKDSKYSNVYPLRNWLEANRPLRSRSWSIHFTFELNQSLDNYSGPLFSIRSSNKSGAKTLFSLNFGPKGSNAFFYSIGNRHYFAEKGAPMGQQTQSFKSKPENELYAVAVTFNDDKNEIGIWIYNSATNFIKQKFTYKGRAENLSLQSALTFGDNHKSAASSIVFEHTHFFYDYAYTEAEVETFISRRLHQFQKACLTSSRIACLKCASGSFLINGFCSKESRAYSGWLNDVKQVTNHNSQTLGTKLFFTDKATQFTVSFWWRLYTYTNNPFGVLNLNLIDGKLTSQLLRVHYANNNLYVDLFNQAKQQVNGIMRDGLATALDGVNWLYISVSIDIPTNTIFLYTYDEKSKKSRISSVTGKTKLALNLNKSKYATANFGYDTTLKGAGYNFEAASFIFTSGWFPKDSTNIELYRVRVPRKCNYRCLAECDSSNLCPANSVLTTDINAGDIYLNANKALQGKLDKVSLQSIRMFRPLYEMLPESEALPIYNDFLITFELDVKAYFSNSYTANKNILFAITNDPNSKYTTLTMNDLVPNEIIQYGVLSLKYTGDDKFEFWIGSSEISHTVTHYNYVITNANKLNYITQQLFMDSRTKRAKAIGYIDDLKGYFDINTMYPIQPISGSTLIYTHPAIKALRINVNNPRFNFDYYNHILNKAQDKATYSSAMCGIYCQKCAVNSSGQTRLHTT